MRYVFVTVLIFLFLSCSGSEPASNSPTPSTQPPIDNHPELNAAIKRIEPFFERMGKPKQYDWLSSYPESGQTFEEYLNSNPTKPTDERQRIYVLPLGTFTTEQRDIIKVTANYLEAFYDLPVTLMSPSPLTQPTEKDDLRLIPSTRDRQIRTGYIMDKILKPILPADAATLIALTDFDLFPDSSMYFVFGQASLSERVGVWSLKRLGDKTDHNTFLLRTLKIAAHETGHMFSLMHCTKYECLLSGTNHLGETDRRPIDACPECTAKVCWMSEIPPVDRYRKLLAFCQRNGLKTEAADFEKKYNAVAGVE